MGVAYYIVLDREEPGFETFVNGKAVARASDKLDTLCHQLALPNLDHYTSMSAEDLADLLGDELDVLEDEGMEGGEPDAERWFAAEEGIRYFTALLEAIERGEVELEESEWLISDLHEYLEVLRQSEAIGAQWHLAIDI